VESENLSPLAINGGAPVRVKPMPSWPYFDDDEIRAVSEVLRSGRVNYWTGDEGVTFETEFAAAHGARHAIALANGTLSLEAALAALEIGPGDEVIMPARTFIATASATVMRGAIPVIADVDPESQNITATSIKAVMSEKTRAVIVVHLAGWPCDMDSILEVADTAKIPVIEDCAQALGAKYKGRPVGTMGAFGSFSFCQDKIMTTGGEGGMLLTSDSALFERAWSLKDHGKSYMLTREGFLGKSHAFRWLHDTFGTNWRMSEMQAVLGRIGMKKLPLWIERRRRFAHMLNEGLVGLDALRLTIPDTNSYHAYYKYYAFMRHERLREGWGRDRIAEAISAEGVPCYSGICPEIYRERAFIKAGLAPAHRSPVARRLGESSLMFLVHPTLEDADIHDTVAAIRKVMAVATT